ncbi:MAG: HXXEE domain-containing protein [Planctomycetota bacterium]
MRAILQRLAANWVYGGFLSAFVIAALGVVLLRDASWALILVYFHLPMYQLHQYEEHEDDRFRTWVNRVIGNHREVLSSNAVLLINIVGVWAVFTVGIVCAAVYQIGFGLAIVYPTLLNGLVHVLPAMVRRQYNPGLGTALLLFLPVSALSIWTVSRADGVGTFHHVVGLLIGVGIHLAIVVHVRRRLRHLQAAEQV